MSTPSIGDCVNKGVETLKKNPVYGIVGMIIMGFVGACTLHICTGPLMAGYWKGLKRVQDGEEGVGPGDVFQGFSMFVPALLVFIIGGLLNIIPLICMPIMPIAMFLVVKGETDGVAAIKRAVDIYKANLVPIWIQVFVLGIVSFIGMIAIGIGALITVPIGTAGLLFYFNSLVDEAGGDAPAEEAPAEETSEEGGDEEEKKEDG